MSNPLTDVLPDRLRKWLYAVVFVAALVFAAFQAADGDWKQFTGSVIASLVPLLAASNTGGSLLPPKKGEGGYNTLDLALVIAIFGLLAGVLALFGVRFDR